MAKVVVMPKLGYTQDEGTIAEWHKQVGDPVAIGDPFFDVHTDKSVITVEASCAGTLLKIALEPGNTVPVFSASWWASPARTPTPSWPAM